VQPNSKLQPETEFDEENYLAVNPDVAEAVGSGAIPSGLWHYLNHGKKEKRAVAQKSIEAVTDNSPIWKKIISYAPFNDQIDDFTLFQHMMKCLRKFESFHIARYNDGEWVFMLQIEPYYSKYIEEHKHNKEEVEQISKELLSIIDSILLIT